MSASAMPLMPLSSSHENGIMVDTLTGDVIFDGDDRISWALFELSVEALVDPELLDGIVPGEAFAALGGLVKGDTGYGAFVIEDILEAGDKQRLLLSFDQIDYYADAIPAQDGPAPIPLPGTLALAMTAGASLFAVRSRRRTNT